ncbi:hypothetical protein [Marinobacterium iners]|uniref:hypothetical protein n=1 Tax=Marinobacterium iners TaxID=48076 RepID=UPI001A8F663C|nr:hypothetical protein [Marinobacterium iners]
MAVDKEMRARINKLIDIYLNWLESTTHNAGWHQPSTLQMMIEYRGQLPERTGCDRSNEKMIAEIRWIREPHANLPISQYLFGVQAGEGVVDHKYVIPLLASRFYRNHPERVIAERIGMTFDQYRGRVSKGLEKSTEELSRVDRLSYLCSAHQLLDGSGHAAQNAH